MKQKLLFLTIIVFSACSNKPKIENFLGNWIPNDPKDSVSYPSIIKNEDGNLFLQQKEPNNSKEIPATYDKDQNILSIGESFVKVNFFYLPDSDRLKVNFNGKSQIYRRISDKEVDSRVNAVVAFKRKQDSLLKIKQKKMDSVMKNKDNQIINDILKNARHL